MKSSTWDEDRVAGPGPRMGDLQPIKSGCWSGKPWGYSPDQFVKVVFRGLTPEQAEKKERALIAFHKKRGDSLFNDQLNADNIRKHRNQFFPQGPQRDTKWKQKKNI